MATLCVYCGSSPGADPAFLEAARRVGTLLAQEGHTLVYGAGNVGLMGAVADAALAAGGTVIGFIPQSLVDREVAHPGLTQLHITRTMHERKQHMAERADAFLALPGGIGTLEEIIEVFVWTQLGIHPKPCALLNVNGFYDPLLGFMRHMVGARFLRPEHADQLLVGPDPERLLTTLLTNRPVHLDKWMDRCTGEDADAPSIRPAHRPLS
jgi:uncharacterized protein (TIGR00730 family)